MAKQDAEVVEEKGKLVLKVSTANFRANMSRVFRELDSGAVDTVHVTSYGRTVKVITLPTDFQPERAQVGAFDLSS